MPQVITAYGSSVMHMLTTASSWPDTSYRIRTSARSAATAAAMAAALPPAGSATPKLCATALRTVVPTSGVVLWRPSESGSTPVRKASMPDLLSRSGGPAMGAGDGVERTFTRRGALPPAAAANWPYLCCSKSSLRLFREIPRCSQSAVRSQQRMHPLASAVYTSGASVLPQLSAQTGMGCTEPVIVSCGEMGSWSSKRGRFLKRKTGAHLSGCGRTRHSEIMPPWSAAARRHRLGRKSMPAIGCWNFPARACSNFSVLRS
mmetsp:Transcript_94202/g.299038  ORF Transcript_94202/g.299038 Transcript_94202/m.299038 type:complete len:261 (-) Transcript_94202:349-1131(-)